ncbi:MAG: hypothetical protein ACFB9N_03415 [Geitlerinemataceae cyanobacterium]
MPDRRNQQKKLFAVRNHPEALLRRQTQEVVFGYLLKLVRESSGEDAIAEFRSLFIELRAMPESSASQDALKAISGVIAENQPEEFYFTLKRSCYILFNNWETQRQPQFIPQLLSVFQDASIRQRAISPQLQRLRAWLNIFVEASDYKDLQVFTAKYQSDFSSAPAVKWSDRYTAYLLVPQFVDPNNPNEQREVARAVSQRLKDCFTLDLALYTTRSQLAKNRPTDIPNPTIFGDDTLRVIATLVSSRSRHSHANLATTFLRQMQDSPYVGFKNGLLKYLSFSWSRSDLSRNLKKRLGARLSMLYRRNDEDPLDDALLLRTCNRTIDFFTMETDSEPAPLFVWMMSSSNPLRLALALIKIAAISPNSRLHLETRVAQLIRYYQDLDEERCQWVIQFFELFKIASAIHSKDVEYSLVEVENTEIAPAESESSAGLLSGVRIFAQVRFDRQRLNELARDDTRSETFQAGA